MYPLSGCLLWACRSHLTLGESSNTFLEIEMLHMRTSSSNCTNTTPHTRAWRRCIGSKRKDDSFTPILTTTIFDLRLSENWGSARLEEVGDLPTPLLPSSIPGHVLMKSIR